MTKSRPEHCQLIVPTFFSILLIAAAATHVLILLPGDTTPAAQLPPKPKTGPLP